MGDRARLQDEEEGREARELRQRLEDRRPRAVVHEERERERQDREGEEENGEGAVEAVEEGGRGDGGAGEHAGAVADRASEHECELGVRRVVVVELAEVVADVRLVKGHQPPHPEPLA